MMLAEIFLVAGFVLAGLYMLLEWWEGAYAILLRNQEETGLGLKEQWQEFIHHSH